MRDRRVFSAALSMSRREPMRQIGLVSCTKSKRGEPALPRDLHEPSALFRKARAYCEQHHDAWYVLSAKQGSWNLMLVRSHPTTRSSPMRRLTSVERGQHRSKRSSTKQAYSRRRQNSSFTLGKPTTSTCSRSSNRRSTTFESRQRG